MGWDGSETADGALELASDLAAAGDELVVATVIPARLKDRSFLHMLFPQMEIPDELKANSYAKNALARLEERLAALETEAEARATVRAGDPADELLSLCREEEADHLVIGFKSYEKDLPYHVGSIAEKLIRYAELPITVYRPRAGDSQKKT